MTRLGPNEKLGNRYTVIRELNSGGFARVYLCRTAGGDEVALKISDTDGGNDDQIKNDAILREVDLLKQFNHSRIVKIYPIEGERNPIYFFRAPRLKGEPWFFVMEYLSGVTLADHLKQVGKLMPEEAAQIAGNIALGVKHIQSESNLSHNDIKTENVMFRGSVKNIGDQFDPVLIDFGIAAELSQHRPVALTQHIMPPEMQPIPSTAATQPKGDRDPGKVDVWTIGVLLYEMLTRKTPFESRDQDKLADQVRNQNPLPPSRFNKDVPPEFDRFIINHCMAKPPRDRPNIDEVIRFLHKHGKGATALTVSRSFFG